MCDAKIPLLRAPAPRSCVTLRTPLSGRLRVRHPLFYTFLVPGQLAGRPVITTPRVTRMLHSAVTSPSVYGDGRVPCLGSARWEGFPLHRLQATRRRGQKVVVAVAQDSAVACSLSASAGPRKGGQKREMACPVVSRGDSSCRGAEQDTAVHGQVLRALGASRWAVR